MTSGNLSIHDNSGKKKIKITITETQSPYFFLNISVKLETVFCVPMLLKKSNQQTPKPNKTNKQKTKNNNKKQANKQKPWK